MDGEISVTGSEAVAADAMPVEVAGSEAPNIGEVVAEKAAPKPVESSPAESVKPVFEGEVPGFGRVKLNTQKDFDKFMQRLGGLASGAYTAQRKAAELEKMLSDKETVKKVLRERGFDQEIADELMAERIRRASMTKEELEAEEGNENLSKEAIKIKEENQRLKNILVEQQYMELDRKFHDGMAQRGTPINNFNLALAMQKVKHERMAHPESVPDYDAIMDEVHAEYQKAMSLNLSEDPTEEEVVKRLSKQDMERLEKLIRKKMLAEASKEPTDERVGWTGDQAESPRSNSPRRTLRDLAKGR